MGNSLGRRDHEYRLLGKSLTEERNGKTVHVLHYAGDWHVLNV